MNGPIRAAAPPAHQSRKRPKAKPASGAMISQAVNASARRCFRAPRIGRRPIAEHTCRLSAPDRKQKTAQGQAGKRSHDLASGEREREKMLPCAANRQKTNRRAYLQVIGSSQNAKEDDSPKHSIPLCAAVWIF